VPSGSILTVNPYIYKDMGFDPKKDLVPITNLAQGPMVIVVNPNVQARNLRELIALAKKEPGQLNFGSAGVGSQVHMAGENFADAAGIDIRHIPYKGEAAGLNDLMGGQIQLMVGNLAAASSFVKAGRLRALAVTGKERSSMIPDVPTAQEAGLPGFESVGWFGLMAPAGTPKAIVDKIQADTAKVLQDPAVKKALADQGMTPVGNTPEEMGRAIAAESQKWQNVVAHRHLQMH
jgi:tripartite-type tricarboxylate transporter receptor subunit TctC